MRRRRWRAGRMVNPGPLGLTPAPAPAVLVVGHGCEVAPMSDEELARYGYPASEEAEAPR